MTIDEFFPKNKFPLRAVTHVDISDLAQDMILEHQRYSQNPVQHIIDQESGAYFRFKIKAGENILELAAWLNPPRTLLNPAKSDKYYLCKNFVIFKNISETHFDKFIENIVGSKGFCPLVDKSLKANWASF